MRARWALLVSIALLFVVPSSNTPAATGRYPAGDVALPLPSSMAALGDSITRAYNACGGFADCPDQSWSTGTDPSVKSHYLRLLAVNPAIQGHATNLASSGAKIDDLARQATAAAAINPGYVTILIGANDACASSEEAMTSVADFRARLDDAMRILAADLPKTRLFIASIPDLLRLWEVEHRDRLAQIIWSVGSICPSMLADARSVDADDVARRERVHQRVADYNEQFRQACAAYGPRCRFDGNVVFEHPFVAGEVSSLDAFHPDVTGQAAIAEVTSVVGYDW